MASIPLPTNHMSAPGPATSSMTTQTSRTVGSNEDAAFVQNYTPLFSAPVAATDHAGQCLSGQDGAAPALTDPSQESEAVGPSVITHTATSPVTNYSSLSTPVPPPPSQLQPFVPTSGATVQQAHSFIVPHPIRPSNNNPSVQTIALSNTVSSPHLILTGLLFFLSSLNQRFFWGGLFSLFKRPQCRAQVLFSPGDQAFLFYAVAKCLYKRCIFGDLTVFPDMLI